MMHAMQLKHFTLPAKIWLDHMKRMMHNLLEPEPTVGLMNTKIVTWMRFAAIRRYIMPLGMFNPRPYRIIYYIFINFIII